MAKTDNIVISSRIRFARNINNLPFPQKLVGNEPKLKELFDTVKEVCDSKFKNSLYYIPKLKNLDANVLIENHLISPLLCKSEYGGVVLSADKTISVMINEEDHLREQCILQGYALDDAYKKLLDIDKALRGKLDIAFKEGYGHLTACPTNLGAGMRASVMMFLPALTMTHTIDAIIRKMNDHGVAIRGVYGEGSTADGYMYQVSNQAAVGRSEQEILNIVKSVVDKLCDMEEQNRSLLLSRRGIDLEDEIMRAYGTLLFAKKISSQEFMRNIAMVKLGVDYGFIKQDIKVLNKLITDTQKNTLCYNVGKELSVSDRDIYRSRLVRETLTKKA